ncbi:unnamed protein product [Mesocestoides corti]|uniref:Galectin domain-containing protein n=1 Tax=Mesocestoides corti TaxID=53468 RepID=A0A0R3UJU4_MESCO|nr:unnamed protein product [Mesocestoides corti]
MTGKLVGWSGKDPCFHYPIPGGLLDRDVIEITGKFTGEKIVIEILAESYVQNGVNIALPLQFTLSSKGNWTASTYTQAVHRQVQSGTTTPKESFQIRIIALDTAFEVYLDGVHLCTQKHLIPLPEATHLSIDGDAEFTGVEFKDLCTENDASTHSNSLTTEQNQFGAAAEVTPGFTRFSENRRSSNRKPRSPILVPTHGSFRAKPTLATNLEEPSLSQEVSVPPAVIAAAAAEPVHAAMDSSMGSLTPTAISGKRSLHGSGVAGSGHRESKHKSLREKLHLKKSSKVSTSAVTTEENQYANTGKFNDVWVEEGGRELSADGTGAFVVAGAVSEPNLHTRPEKEKKRLSLLHGSKKTRSASSPPAEASATAEGKEKKKKHHIGPLHFGHGSKHEGKSAKDAKKKTSSGKGLEAPQKSSTIGAAKVADGGSAVGTGAVLATQEVKLNSENSNIDPLHEPAPTLLAKAHGRQNSSSPGSSRPASQAKPSVHLGGHVKGFYDLQEAEKTYDVHRGTFRKVESGAAVAVGAESNRLSRRSSNSSTTSSRNAVAFEIAQNAQAFDFAAPPDARSRSASASSHSSTESLNKLGAGAAADTAHTKKSKGKSGQLKGESPEIADQMLMGHATSLNSLENLTYTDPSLNIPLQLAGLSESVVSSSKDLHSKKEAKLKGDASEIADNLLGERRAMSGEFTTYTSDNKTVPLKLTHEDLLSTGGKGFTPLVGPKGSYDLENSSSVPAGSYRLREDTNWSLDSGSIVAQTTGENVQHSEPPVEALAVGVAAPAASKKSKKISLKGESAEIASDLLDASNKNLRIPDGGNPLCGENGVIAPWKLTATNRDAQLGSYYKFGQTPTDLSSRNRSFDDTGAGIGAMAIAAAHEENVYAEAPSPDQLVGGGSYERVDSFNLKSSTLPASGKVSTKATGSAPGSRATLPAAGVVVAKDKDKKDKKHHEGAEKGRKRDRVSGFFRRIFRRKKKSGGAATQSDDEGGEYTGDFESLPEMYERGSDSERSFDSDDHHETEFAITASPSETGLYAAQLRGDRSALSVSRPIESMCGTTFVAYPLKLTSLAVAEQLHAASLSQTSGDRVHRSESASSWSSVSVGGTRRRRRRPSPQAVGGITHRSESSSSHSSLKGFASRDKMETDKPVVEVSHAIPSFASIPTHRSASTSSDSWRGRDRPGVADGSLKKDRRSISLSRSPSPEPPMPSLQMEQQVFTHTAPPNGRDQPYSPFHDSKKHENGAGSTSSSTSSINSLYGRIVIVGQSSDFSKRIQSFRKRMQTTPKAKRSKGTKKRGENGFDSDTSTSSISSIESAQLPPTVVKSREGQFGVLPNAGETIFYDKPLRKEDTYANSML